MCLAPMRLPNGKLASCRKCWQCAERTKWDWIGRNIAQSKTVKAAHWVTLTYGRNSAGEVQHLRSLIPMYSDVQKYLKKLRFHGYDFSFFVTGEYGTLKGRVHWNCLMYWRDKVPEHELFTQQYAGHEYWDHGFTYWEPISPRRIKYTCKYIMKPQGDEDAIVQPGFSKVPPIGLTYFRDLADRHVAQGIAPQTLEYKFAGVTRKARGGGRELVPFRLKGRVAELYLEHFIERWAAVYPGAERPRSDLVELFEKYGKVVTDEDDLLLRREFPEGERFAYRPWPTSAERKATEEQVRAEKAQRDKERAVEERDRYMERWVKEGWNEQERQKRQRQWDAERRRRENEWYDAAFPDGPDKPDH